MDYNVTIYGRDFVKSTTVTADSRDEAISDLKSKWNEPIFVLFEGEPEPPYQMMGLWTEEELEGEEA